MTDPLFELIQTGLTPQQQIWRALAPALVIVAYPLLGLPVYAWHMWTKGRYRDPELAARGASVLVGVESRHYFAWLMQPIWRLVHWTALPANALTTLSVLLVTAAAVAVAVGRFSLGGWLYVFGGLCDFFDGRLARAHGTAGPRGAALDSILDRYCDGIILVGLSWYYRATWVLAVLGVLMIATFMVSYVRARGESLGVSVKVGLMQRPERIVYLALALVFAPVFETLYQPQIVRPGPWLAVLAIALLTAATAVTAVHRVLFLLKALQRDGAVSSWKGVDRGSLVRFSTSSTIATISDFGFVMLLVAALQMDPWRATLLGCAVGAVLSFTINRLWAFRAGTRTHVQLLRYGFVSLFSALLNAGGVATLLMLSGLDYRLAWIVARVAVFLFWNYPLNRDYVFDHEDGSAETAAIDHGDGSAETATV